MTKMILMAIGNAWCVIPVSFNKIKMVLNASGCSVRSAMKHHMPPQCIPEVHRIYFSFESEDEEEYIYPNCTNLAEDSDNYNL